MLGSIIGLTISGLGHPTVRRVTLSAILLASFVLVGMCVAVVEFWPDGYKIGWAWVDGIGMTLGLLLACWLLFPALVSMVIALQLEKITDAVEQTHYPNNVAARSVPLGEALWSGLKLLALMLSVNIVALPLYLVLSFFSAGLASAVLYLLINGYLLSREYFELVAHRHISADRALTLRHRNRGDVLLLGMAVAGLFLIPVFNILAPIVGVAAMTHLAHKGGLDGGQTRAAAHAQL